MSEISPGAGGTTGSGYVGTQPASFTPVSDQWLRRWSLVVKGDSGTILELTAGQGTATGIPTTDPQGAPVPEGLRMRFHTFAADIGIPNHMEVDIYNLSDATSTRLINSEFSAIILQAGYVTGKYGIIFAGTIKQVKRGRENAVDSYVRIYAADGDYALTQSTIGPIVMDRASAAADRGKAIQQYMAQNGGIKAGPIDGLIGGILPRQKIIWGMANDNLDTTSRPLTQWSIQNGTLQITKMNSHLSGEVVILNAHSGLVQVPEATQQGVFAVALLNPSVKVKGLVKINNGDINTSEPAIARTTVLQQGDILQQGYPGFTDFNFFASTSADGVYVVIMIEYEGDTRGNPWYMKLVCLLLDASTSELVSGNAAPDANLLPKAIAGTHS